MIDYLITYKVLKFNSSTVTISHLVPNYLITYKVLKYNSQTTEVRSTPTLFNYLFGIYIFKSIFALIIVGIFPIAYLGLYILSELFKQAVQFKEENDLTI